MRVVSLSSNWNAELVPLLDPTLEFTQIDPDDGRAADAALPNAEVLISARFTPEMGRACRRLQLLVCPAAGTEGIDRSALPNHAQLVHGTGHEIPMAEYVIGCLVGLRQHLLDADHALRSGEWKYGFLGSQGVNEELYDSALGMIGFGAIGTEVVGRARAFGMRCAAVTLHPEKPRDGAAALEFLGHIADPSDVDRLVKWCDALVLCCELSDVTRGIIDSRRFGLLKRSAVVVSIARGPVLRERDFYEALRSGRIAGAAIDVWYKYPPDSQRPSEFPFEDLPNVIMTPHASAWTHAATQRRVAAMAAAINGFARAHSRV